MDAHDTRYAKTPDDVYIAYQVVGDGPLDLVWQFDWLGNVDLIWEEPVSDRILSSLSTVSRLILHDRRATGLSSRNVPVPNLETRVADLLSVLDAVDAPRPALGGEREGGAPNVLFAATVPERIRSLIWYAPSACSVWTPDYPWGARAEYIERDERALEFWGTAEYAQAFLEAEASEGHIMDPHSAALFGMLSRHTTTPDVAREMSRVWLETDIRELLPAVHVPTLLLVFEEPESGVREAEHIASLMPQAEVAVLPGEEATGNNDLLVETVERFLGIDRPPEVDTVLSTVLFTDIVGSTKRQSELGDRGWKRLVEQHHAIVRDSLGRWRGAEIDTAGDGFYATFDGPARAIRSAMEIADRVRELGIEIRAGVHTGECEVIDGKYGGLTVTIGARVAATAGPSEVRVSQTVKDIVAGSGLRFQEAGEHELKGVPDEWRLYAVVAD